MNDAPQENDGRPPAKRLQGIGVAVVAAILAATGLLLSYFQARSIMEERSRIAQQDAVGLAALARQRFINRLDGVFAQVATAPSGAYRPPFWIRSMYLWQDGTLQPLHPVPPVERVDVAAIARGVREMEADLPSRDALPGEPRFHPLVEAGAPGAYPYFLASSVPRPRDPDAPRFVLLVNRYPLPPNLLDEFQSKRNDLELVGEDFPFEDGHHFLDENIPAWRVQPTIRFMNQQRQVYLQQLFLNGPVTGLCLAALVGMIWQMSKIVHRERALSEMKSSFVANVSHELKTPLSLIHLYGETLLEGRVPSEDKKHEYYDVIIRESNRLTHLIDNLLDFSRISAERKEYHRVPQDIGELIRQTYEAYRLDLDHQGVEHELTLEDGLPTLYLDRHAIAQALLNLMNNAVKYSDDDRFVGIEVEKDTRRDRRGVLISVHDRGIGIAPEDRNRVFEGFFRSGAVRDRRGTGLGLALVKHIVAGHGGSVSVESRLVKGTTFRIFLPEGPPDDTQLVEDFA